MSESKRGWVITVELSEPRAADNSTISFTPKYQTDLKTRIARLGLPAALRVGPDAATMQLRMDGVPQLEAWRVAHAFCSDLLATRMSDIDAVTVTARVASV